jgi:hypothetical protein
MITNLVESVQKNLGYAPLQKVDPNTQEIKEFKKLDASQRLAQAAIPAVIAAMIKYSDSPEGETLLSGEADCMNNLYHEKQQEAIKTVSDYAGVEKTEAEEQMRNICTESTKLLREGIKQGEAEKLRTFMNSQRHNVLAYLPAALNMGYILNEETFDDRTNKMEGPVSGFLHRIENII